MTNPLQFGLNAETTNVVDEILGPFLFSRIGQNDMSVANGLLVSVAILLAVHCQRTGEDPQELADLFRHSFDLALEIAIERTKK